MVAVVVAVVAAVAAGVAAIVFAGVAVGCCCCMISSSVSSISSSSGSSSQRQAAGAAASKQQAAKKLIYNHIIAADPTGVAADAADVGTPNVWIACTRREYGWQVDAQDNVEVRLAASECRALILETTCELTERIGYSLDDYF